MNLLGRIKGGRDPERMTLDEYGQLVSLYMQAGFGYQTPALTQTLAGTGTERPADNFLGLASQAYAANGVVFACMLVRQLVFSSIRFQFQGFNKGKPSETFGDQSLRILERPWPGGTTQDLLTRMIQDADLAGNSYWVRQGDELVRLRPDWVSIIGKPRHINGGQVGWTKLGYVYTEGGAAASRGDGVPFTVDEVVHFAPTPDPLAVFTGMSWLTPVIREIQADQAMTRHQRKFFDNGATANMVIRHAQGAVEDKVKKWVEEFGEKHVGVENAYRTLQLYPGADVTVIGSNMREVDFTKVRGAGETRVAAAAGTPPIIVGLSEGLAAATYSNYGQARRRFADGTMHPLWQNAAGSIENVVPAPSSTSRLWYDPVDVPFLREDEADAANIAAVRAATINTYLASGFTAESAVKAVDAGDINLLAHTGLVSVQLLPPGTPKPAAPDVNGNGSTNDAPPLTLLRRNSDGSTRIENASAQ